MNGYTIAAAIATRFSGMTVPTGEPSIKLCTADIPSVIGGVPCILVYLGDGEHHGSVSTRQSTYKFRVRMLLGKYADIGISASRLGAWHEALIARLDGQVMLGLSASGVQNARLLTSRPMVLTHADVDYTGHELEYEVNVLEGVEYTA